MTILRAPRPKSHFTIIYNSTARDDAISDGARGLLVRVLSFPDNWRLDADELSRKAVDARNAGNKEHPGEGRTETRAHLKELETAGYLIRTKSRGADGRFTTESVIYDVPQNRTPRQERSEATANPQRNTTFRKKGKLAADTKHDPDAYKAPL